MSAGLRFDRFTGVLPRVPEDQLPLNAAAVAENINFGYGQLRSLKDGLAMKTIPAGTVSVWSEDGERFYAWPVDVNAVTSPLKSGDSADRLYYTTPDDFRVTLKSNANTSPAEPGASYRVGVPRPTAKPTVTATGGSSTTLVTRAYVATFVNIYNEEGPPSDPFLLESVKEDSAFSVSQAVVDFDDYVPVKEVRIYRTSNNGGVTADYYFAFAISAIGLDGTTVSAADIITDSGLNEILSSLNFYAPDPEMVGLMNVGNGILAGWKGNQLYFSEPFKPWAWPPAYVKALPWTIVGAIPQAAGCFVTTIASPYSVYGTLPESMTETKLNINQAGVSKWAMADINGAVVYASHDGLVTVSGGLGSLDVSQKFFTREVWRGRYGAGLAGMQMCGFDGGMIVFSRTGAFDSFVIRSDEGDGNMADLPDFTAKSATYIPTTDGLYFVRGTQLHQYGAGADLPVRWRSKQFYLPDPECFGAVYVDCTGTFAVDIMAGDDGELLDTVNLTGPEVFRLPDSLGAQSKWQVEFRGTGVVRQFAMAKSARDMKRL